MRIDHLLASAAIPGLFRPEEIDGHTYWDGGLISNTPLTAALAYEPDTAIVAASGAVERDAGVPQSLGELASLAIDHLMRFAMVKDIDHAKTVNQLVAAAPDATKHRAVEIIDIVPETAHPGLGNVLDFEPSVASQLITEGYRATTRRLEEWQEEHGALN